MCYAVYLSTSSPTDLAAESNDLVRFEKKGADAGISSKLAYPHQWYVGSKTGCSCTFRHLMSPELGFGKPVDWYPEDSDAVEATARFIAVVRRALERGDGMDCIDKWSGEVDDAVEMTVDLNLVKDEDFRFFENHRFVFTKG